MPSQRQLSYPLAQQWWSDDDPASLFVKNQSKQMLLVAPLMFWEVGHVTTIGYIIDRVHDSFEDPGSLRFENTIVSADQEAQASQALHNRDDGVAAACTPRKGPRFK